MHGRVATHSRHDAHVYPRLWIVQRLAMPNKMHRLVLRSAGSDERSDNQTAA